MRVIRAEQMNGEKDSEDERRPLLSRLMEHSYDPKRGIMTDEEVMSESVSHLCVDVFIVIRLVLTCLTGWLPQILQAILCLTSPGNSPVIPK